MRPDLHIEQDLIINEIFTSAMSYEQYSQLVVDMYNRNEVSSGDPTESMLNYTKMNIQRAQRWEKRGEIEEVLSNILKHFPRKMAWLVITEGWCGDAAQNLPFVYKMSELSPNIELKLIFRDQNLEIMDNFLTNGSRSIPKLIAMDAESLSVIGTWGPRPAVIHEEYMAMLANPEMENTKATEHLHLWYARDKGRTLQSEFMALLSLWK